MGRRHHSHVSRQLQGPTALLLRDTACTQRLRSAEGWEGRPHTVIGPLQKAFEQSALLVLRWTLPTQPSATGSCKGLQHCCCATWPAHAFLIAQLQDLLLQQHSCSSLDVLGTPTLCGDASNDCLQQR